MKVANVSAFERPASDEDAIRDLFLRQFISH